MVTRRLPGFTYDTVTAKRKMLPYEDMNADGRYSRFMTIPGDFVPVLAKHSLTVGTDEHLWTGQKDGSANVHVTGSDGGTGIGPQPFQTFWVTSLLAGSGKLVQGDLGPIHIIWGVYLGFSWNTAPVAGGLSSSAVSDFTIVPTGQPSQNGDTLASVMYSGIGGNGPYAQNEHMPSLAPYDADKKWGTVGGSYDLWIDGSDGGYATLLMHYT